MCMVVIGKLYVLVNVREHCSDRLSLISKLASWRIAYKFLSACMQNSSCAYQPKVRLVVRLEAKEKHVVSKVER